jgi:hypothetical protein
LVWGSRVFLSVLEGVPKILQRHDRTKILVVPDDVVPAMFAVDDVFASMLTSTYIYGGKKT